LRVVLWGLLELTLLIILWRNIHANWDMLRNSYRTLPGQTRRTLVLLTMAAVVLMLYGVTLLLVDERAGISAIGSWFLATVVLIQVSCWLRKP